MTELIIKRYRTYHILSLSVTSPSDTEFIRAKLLTELVRYCGTWKILNSSFKLSSKLGGRRETWWSSVHRLFVTGRARRGWWSSKPVGKPGVKQLHRQKSKSTLQGVHPQNRKAGGTNWGGIFSALVLS
jgi:hypothetical protein